jgi:hypothetical protein
LTMRNHLGLDIWPPRISYRETGQYATSIRVK